MDTDIQTSISNASPIAAYGTSPRRKFPHILLILGCFFALLVIGGLVSLFFIEIPFPKNTPVTALLHSKTSISSSLPNAWDETLRISHTPVILGLASEKNGFEPFAIVPRFQPTPGLNRINQGLFSLVSQHPIQEVENQKAISWLIPVLKLTKYPAILSLYIYREDGSKTGTITGPIKENLWLSDARIFTPAFPLPDWPNSINFEVLPAAWSALKHSLEQTQGWEFSQAPRFFSWMSTSTAPQAFNFTFADKVPTSTAVSVMATFGLHDSSVLTLKDGSTIDEYSKPIELLNQTASSSWEVSPGTYLKVQGNELQLDPIEILPTIASNCPGQAIARLNGETLNQIIQNSNFSISLPIKQLTASVLNDKLIICTE